MFGEQVELSKLEILELKKIQDNLSRLLKNDFSNEFVEGSLVQALTNISGLIKSVDRDKREELKG